MKDIIEQLDKFVDRYNEIQRHGDFSVSNTRIDCAAGAQNRKHYEKTTGSDFDNSMQFLFDICQWLV